MQGDELPNEASVLRYIGKKYYDGENIDGSALLTRPGETALSVNWMDVFCLPEQSQLYEIIKRSRLKYDKRSCLAKLNVGKTKSHVSQNSSISINFVHEPLDEEADKYIADNSHSEIKNMPYSDTPEGEAIRDMIVSCIEKKYPTS